MAGTKRARQTTCGLTNRGADVCTQVPTTVMNEATNSHTIVTTPNKDGITRGDFKRESFINAKRCRKSLCMDKQETTSLNDTYNTLVQACSVDPTTRKTMCQSIEQSHLNKKAIKQYWDFASTADTIGSNDTTKNLCDYTDVWPNESDTNRNNLKNLPKALQNAYKDRDDINKIWNSLVANKDAMTRQDLKQFLNRLGFDPTQSEVTNLTKDLTKNENSDLTFNGFLKLVNGKPEASQAATTDTQDQKTNEHDVKIIAGRLTIKNLTQDYKIDDVMLKTNNFVEETRNRAWRCRSALLKYIGDKKLQQLLNDQQSISKTELLDIIGKEISKIPPHTSSHWKTSNQEVSEKTKLNKPKKYVTDLAPVDLDAMLAVELPNHRGEIDIKRFVDRVRKTATEEASSDVNDGLDVSLRRPLAETNTNPHPLIHTQAQAELQQTRTTRRIIESLLLCVNSRKQTSSLTSSLFRAFDTNGDGYVSSADIDAVLRRYDIAQTVGVSHEESVRLLTHNLCKNGDADIGVLTRLLNEQNPSTNRIPNTAMEKKKQEFDFKPDKSPVYGSPPTRFERTVWPDTRTLTEPMSMCSHALPDTERFKTTYSKYSNFRRD